MRLIETPRIGLFVIPFALVTALTLAPKLQIRPDIGINSSLHGRRPFPADNPWNQRVDREPVDPESATLISSIGRLKHLHPDFGKNPNDGIPYSVVAGSAPKVQVGFESDTESDPGPDPIPCK